VYSVGVVVSENLNGYVTWEGHRMNWRLEKDSIGSSDAYFSVVVSQRLVLYPLHSPI
jgi:hypothetical protein